MAIPDYIPPEVGRPRPVDPNTEKIPWAVPGPRQPLTPVRLPKTPADHAREILGFAQDAVGEIAADMLDPAGGLRHEKGV